MAWQEAPEVRVSSRHHVPHLDLAGSAITVVLGELVSEGAGISHKRFIDITSGETLKLNLTLK